MSFMHHLVLGGLTIVVCIAGLIKICPESPMIAFLIGIALTVVSLHTGITITILANRKDSE